MENKGTEETQVDVPPASLEPIPEVSEPSSLKPVLLEENPTTQNVPPPIIPTPAVRAFFSRRTAFATLTLFVVCIIVAGVWYMSGTSGEDGVVKSYTNVYSFVPEKISQNAAIPVKLPKGVNKEVAEAHISFTPEVKGSWISSTEEDIVLFDPADPLTLGTYYAVTLRAPEAEMKGDFYVDEDPRVEAVFPAEETESSEDTEITIVFNRPMVPLTTLTSQEAFDIPITITPETPGRFKWISTRNLQFVPETTLIPASDYTVSVREGFVSIDGIHVEPMEHTFSTRALRYEEIQNGVVGYRSPLRVRFNQSFDLEKTKEKVSVARADGKNVPLIMTYGEKTSYDKETKKDVTTEDRQTLFIFQKEDAHGRKNVWDFETSYVLTIQGAVPLYGTGMLDEERVEQFAVPSVVENVSADSPRSSLVRRDLLDPQGTLILNFYEDIDKDKSTITLPGMESVVYGTRCKKDVEGEEVMRGSSCEKEDNPRSLIFSFNESRLQKNAAVNLTLEKLYARDGVRINQDPITIPLHTYGPLSLYRTVPEQGSRVAPVDSFTVCSSAPLKDPGEKGIREYVSADKYIVYGRWEGSRYVEQKYELNQCEVGQFETKLLYGLLPDTDYQIRLALVDVFDQRVEQALSVHTKSAENIYTRFHNLQKQYNVTTPDKTTLTYAVENLEYVNMHMCRLSPEGFLARTQKKMQEGGGDSVPPQSNDCLQVIEKHIPLSKNYWVNNYFQVRLADYFPDVRGQYVITFSHPLYLDTYRKTPLYDQTFVSVTRLAVGKKEVRQGNDRYAYSQSDNPARNMVRDRALSTSHNLYWISDARSLAPVAGARVAQYHGGYDVAFGSEGFGTTDGQGVARVPVGHDVMGAVVYAGDDVAVLSDWADVLEYSQNTVDASRTYVYTDRPIYRPGHTVYVRGIDRIGFDGMYEVWNKEPVTLTAYDSRGASIYSTKLPINTYGTFNTSFALPQDAPLGTYRIEVFGMNAWFDVEEYVPAAFKLTASSNKEEYIHGDTVRIDLDAQYYFGVPVDNGTVEYSATAQDYYFDRYTDEYFNFGSAWYYCYSCGYGDTFLFRGQTTLDEKGHASIERTFALSDYFENLETEGSKLVTLSLTAKDMNGRSVSTQKSFIVHKGSYYIGAHTDRYYTDVATPLTLRVKTVDTNGKPLGKSGLTRTVSKVTWNTFKRQEVDGGFYYRSDKELTQVSSEKIRTDGNGSWSGSLALGEEGQYEIRIEGTDDSGATISTTITVYVYGSDVVSIPPNNNYELSLETERQKVEVGDTASILIKSPYPKAKVLITAERGEIYDYWIVDVVGGLYRHEFPITSRYSPNVQISALLISPDPEVKYGSVRFEVGRKEHELSVEVHANKETYLPGEVVTLRVTTKDHRGTPVPAEVSLAVADLSVLALKGNPKKDPLIFFYDDFALSVTTSANLKNVLYETSIPLGTKGGSGSTAEDLAKKKRGLFKDTALWNASLVTNERGEGTVTFTLPDNLTTWQVESLGVTEDTKLGVGYREFGTQKPLMAVPLKPRFVVPGDTFSLGATVFNETDAKADVAVSLSSDTLKFTGEHEDTISVGPKESKTVYFTVEAPENKRRGEHLFTFKATGNGLEDTVEQVIPITPNLTYETVATAEATKDDRATEYLYIPKEVVSGEGGLTINANATMAVFMTDALQYMVSYPYGCSEQLSSSLSTIATLRRSLSVPHVEGSFDTLVFDGVTYTTDAVVKEGLSRIYEAQTEGGGFSYYKGLLPNVFLTAQVLLALAELEASGYEVREGVIRGAQTYLESTMRTQYATYPDQNKDLLILSEYALRRTNGGKSTGLTSQVKTLMGDTAFVGENASSLSLAYLSLLAVEGDREGYSQAEARRVYTSLTNRINIDGRGAYLKKRGQGMWVEGENSVVNTALLLKVFVAHEDEHETLPQVLRWLLASRDTQGVWGGTHNTFVVVDAMTDYLLWKHETESRFSLKGLLGGLEIFVHEFTAKNIFETFTHFVPIDTLARETLIPLVFERTSTDGGGAAQKNNFYYDMALKYFLPVENIAPRDEGITITRELFALSDTKGATPLEKAAVGDIVRGKIVLTIPGEYAHVSVEDMIPAGFEIVNFNLDTEDQSLQDGLNEDDSYEGEYYGGVGYVPPGKSLVARLFDVFDSFFGNDEEKEFGVTPLVHTSRTLRPTHIENHDDRLFLYVESLAPGVYAYEYYLRALVPGHFKYLPARAEELYFPEVFGRTNGATFTITE